LKEGSRNGASLSVGALLGDPGGGGSFTKDPEGYVKEGSGDGNLHRGPAGEPGSRLMYQGL